MNELHFFDPGQEFNVVERRLPHRIQAGVICFMTYRTLDSLPSAVIERCLGERDALLRQHDIDPKGNWRQELQRLEPFVRRWIQWAISERWDIALDECHGSCILKRPELSEIVASNLLYLDGTNYDLTDFVVMPNHVHLLASFHSADAMLKRAAAWRRYQARRINEILQTSGHFWQEDGFDHLVRSPEQFEQYRRYIANNPIKARLKPTEYVLYSKVLE